MTWFLLGLIAFISAAFFTGAFFLLLIERAFGVEHASYHSSLKSLLFCSLAFLAAPFIVGLPLHLLSPIPVDTVLLLGALVLPFLLFGYLSKKYHRTYWMKSLSVFGIFVVVAISFLWALRTFVVSPYVINGPSMVPAFDDGAYVLITPLHGQLERDDVVVFAYPKEPHRILVSRVAALPMERISVDKGAMGATEVAEQPSIEDREKLKKQRAAYSPVLGGEYVWILGPQEYFVLGDNREISLDSRYFGPISESAIRGKVFYTFSAPVSRGLNSLFSWIES